MTDSDIVLSLGNEGSRFSLAREGTRRKLTAISARIGVWGIMGGLASMIFGVHAPGLASGLAGVGFLAGGLGAIGTSVLVTKDLKRASLPLKLAALVGFPFGACMIIFASGQFFQLPLPPQLWVLSLPAGVLLGVTLIILLLAGFLSHAFFERESELED